MSQWIAAAVDEAVDQGAQVINLSLGGPHSAVLHNAVAKAVDQGVVVVAAAGNSSSEGLGCPAHVDGVVAVSATGPDDSLAPYSTWGKGVVLAAPGGDKRVEGGGILQDTIDGQGGHAFRELQGTSMATPHVAGSVAVMLGAGAGPKSVERLIGAAQDRGDQGYDTKYGHGRLDLAAAVVDLQVQQNGLLFALGGLLGLGLTWLGAIPQRKTVVLAAAITAGGLFFLPLLPVRPFLLVQLLGRPLLDWPALVSVGLAATPIWLSALLPAVLTFVLGPTRTLGPLALGIVAGIGVHLGYGAATGSFDPRWLPGGLATGWLWGNAALCGLCALLILGVQKVRRRAET
jgi:serine protease